MKSRKFLFLFIVSVVVIGISCYLSLDYKKKNQSFVLIPVRFFPFQNKPTMEIEIEGKKYSLLIDLGASQFLTLQKSCLDKIKSKSSISSSETIGIKGNVYCDPGFEIPRIVIQNNLTITNAPVFEKNIEFSKDANIWPSDSLWDRLKLAIIDGSIGLGVFQNLDCFFDFPRSELIVAESITALTHDARCSLHDFIQVPFTVEQFGVVLSFETDLGNKKFILDTGATLSLFRESVVPKENAEQIESGKWLYTTDRLSIEGHNFGSWSFYLYNFADILACDGILGVDFFKKHTIYLDFHNKIAYIKPYQSAGERLVAWLYSKYKSGSNDQVKTY